MPSVERSTHFALPARDVQAFLSTPSRTAEWLVGFSPGPDPLPDQPASAGTTFSAVFGMAGVSFDVTVTYLEHEDGVYDVLRSEGGVSSTQTWRYQPEGDGTHVTATIDYELPGSVLGQLADKLVIERLNASNLEQSLENARAILGA